MNPSAAAGRCKSWLQDTLNILSTYLPILLMGVLALGTWWLVKNTPVFDAPRSPAAASHTPDYIMDNVLVLRFDPKGHLRTQINGQQLRHYPDTDTVEIDNIRLRSVGTLGEVTTAQGRLGWSNRDGSELRLKGQAKVVREASGRDPAIAFSGESMIARLPQRQVSSDQPITIEREGLRATADSLTYDNGSGIANAQGRVQATYASPSTPSAKRK